MRTRNTTASVMFTCACLSAFVAVSPPKPEQTAATRRLRSVPRTVSGVATMSGSPLGVGDSGKVALRLRAKSRAGYRHSFSLSAESTALSSGTTSLPGRCCVGHGERAAHRFRGRWTCNAQNCGSVLCRGHPVALHRRRDRCALVSPLRLAPPPISARRWCHPKQCRPRREERRLGERGGCSRK
jgi:hypothetical protein